MDTALRRSITAVVALPLCASLAFAQGRRSAMAPSEVINQSPNPMLASFRFRSIGPASMGGRLDDIEIAPSDPNVIWIGYAVGGVWKSVNNGVSFEPVFQTEDVASTGDIAIDPKNANIVYVGTGEANNRQTNSFGHGVYKTTDGGKTWTNIGLQETQSIGRIVIDPNNTDVVYVAAEGHLFGPNKERGVYKTTDGGKTWKLVKFIDENTGFSDIAMDPSNANTLYAASYQRRRLGCCFNGGGPGSAIWKTTNGGESWTKLTGNGLPSGTYGRIALAVSKSSPNVVYAQVEVGNEDQPYEGRGGRGGAAGAAAGGEGGRGGFDWCNNGGPAHGFAPGRGGEPAANQEAPKLDASKGGVFRSDNRGGSWTLTSNCNSRPMYFSQLRIDPTDPNTIYVSGLPVAISHDAGKTFATLDSAGGNGEPAHVDNHAIFIDPRNHNHIMIGNDGGLDVSWDQGKSWDFVSTMATGLSYVVTADNQRPYNVYTGMQDNNSWGGPSSKRGAGGITNMDWFNMCGGDGFYTAVNHDNPNIAYCESQDGNTSRYDFATGRTQSIRPSAGPGPQMAGAPAGGRGGRGANVALTGGNACEAERAGGGGGGGRGGGRKNVVNAQGGEQFRFNWNTPFILSPHDQNIVYLGGNRLFKSYDRGDTWVMSADLTKDVDRCKVDMMGKTGENNILSRWDGVSQYSTIIAVSESPVMPGVVWAGTDDGNLQVSKDGGVTFTEVGHNLPGLPAGALDGAKGQAYWVARVDASHFDAATAYVAVDGHRSDDLHPYAFVTHDYGQTFKSISNDLPAYGNLQVIREDPKNKDLLYVGTEFGLYVSLNGGQHWEKFMNDYPTVRTDDIMIHPRDGDLIVATHGRSLWIADDITPLQQLTSTVQQEPAHLFDVRPAVAYINDLTNDPHIGGQHVFVGKNAPAGTAISYYLKSAATDVKVSVVDAMGRTLCETSAPGNEGVNRVQWTLAAPMLPNPNADAAGFGGGGRAGGGPPNTSCSAMGGSRRGGGANAITPGTYTAKLTVGGQTYTKPITVLEDIWFKGR